MSEKTDHKKFALIGAAGYIAPRHMRAIKDTNNKLIAALDPFDSVGIIDSYFPNADFFIEPERFDRHLDKLKRGKKNKVDFVSICSPNYLHDAHIRLALRNDADAICEKPLLLNPWNIEGLLEIEKESGRKIHNILQLRHHPVIVDLKAKISSLPKGKKHNIKLSYITSRGKWYHYSWKGNISKSGGIVTNIGIHFFDMLSWIFGKAQDSHLHLKQPDKASGLLELENANVSWYLSLDSNDLPAGAVENEFSTFRSITIDDEEIEFSGGFTNLHTLSYQKILAGNSFGIEDSRQSIEIAHTIRNQTVSKDRFDLHPFVKK